MDKISLLKSRSCQRVLELAVSLVASLLGGVEVKRLDLGFALIFLLLY